MSKALRTSKGCLRLYRPINADAQRGTEVSIYLGKLDTIVLEHNTMQFVVYVNGIEHSRHQTIQEADRVLADATGETS